MQTGGKRPQGMIAATTRDEVAFFEAFDFPQVNGIHVFNFLHLVAIFSSIFIITSSSK
jgi:hypothetical protein